MLSDSVIARMPFCTRFNGSIRDLMPSNHRAEHIERIRQARSGTSIPTESLKNKPHDNWIDINQLRIHYF